jgi:EpsI family protein
MSSTAAASVPDPSAPHASLAGHLQHAWREGPARPRMLAGLGAVGLLGVIFLANLRQLVHTWSTDANYSHGFLVPLLSLYFANEAARRGPVACRGGRLLGSALIGVAILGRLATILVPIGLVGDAAFVLGLAGIVATLAGTAALRRYWFALAFLAFMIPLPIALYTLLASPLQLLVSQVASAVLNAIGVPVLCQGNLMTLPGGVRMFVAEACSGMRQLTGFLALTAAVAYLAPRPWWYRAVLVASAVPIAMTANVVRVVLTGLIMHHLDPRFATGSFHTIEGMLMMGLGLGMLAAECAVLGVLAGPPRAEAPVAVGSAADEAPRAVGARRVGLVLGLLLVGVGAGAGLERLVDIPRPPLRRPLATLPLRLGDWVGQDLPVDPEIVERSQADEYLSRSYVDPRHPGRQVTLWVNYSRFGLNLRHSPEVCLPSGGWEKVEANTRVVAVPGPGGVPSQLTQLAYRQGELVQGIGFWYYIFGEGPLERAVRALPITSRSSHGRATRGSGLTVELFCPAETDPDGASMREFARELLGQLEPILPVERAPYHRP